MQSDWAAENLKTIRTLMERSAVYRRALAPLMALLGFSGIAASVLGAFIKFESPKTFVTYWLAVSVFGLVGAFLLIRQQAIKADEPYWSLPTRRIAQAILPALFVGAVAGVPFLIFSPEKLPNIELVVPVWIVLYGCAIHSAGSFMPRGIKIFGWAFILSGCALAFFWLHAPERPPLAYSNLLMGVWFGAIHALYSVYLYFTETSKGPA